MNRRDFLQKAGLFLGGLVAVSVPLVGGKIPIGYRNVRMHTTWNGERWISDEEMRNNVEGLGWFYYGKYVYLERLENMDRLKYDKVIKFGDLEQEAVKALEALERLG